MSFHLSWYLGLLVTDNLFSLPQVTGANSIESMMCLQQHGWRLDAAVDAFFPKDINEPCSKKPRVSACGAWLFKYCCYTRTLIDEFSVEAGL